jgi:hypothetical protein
LDFLDLDFLDFLDLDFLDFLDLDSDFLDFDLTKIYLFTRTGMSKRYVRQEKPIIQ